ncbi:MAG: hypothetical protein V3T61_03130 [Acidobacteriota bacterium]
MIAGLPWTAWLLLVAAAGLGPTLVILFFLNFRSSSGARPRQTSSSPDAD